MGLRHELVQSWCFLRYAPFRCTLPGLFADDSARIDNKDPVVKTGTSDDRIFQKVLHYEGDLDVNKEHTLVSPPASHCDLLVRADLSQTLTNLPSASQGKTGTDFYLDIDYIVVQQPM